MKKYIRTATVVSTLVVGTYFYCSYRLGLGDGIPEIFVRWFVGMFGIACSFLLIHDGLDNAKEAGESPGSHLVLPFLIIGLVGGVWWGYFCFPETRIWAALVLIPIGLFVVSEMCMLAVYNEER